MQNLEVFKTQFLPELEGIVRKCNIINTGFPQSIIKNYSPKFNSIRTNLEAIEKDFNILAKTVNDNINIIFVGNVSAGKSSVINALLGLNILRSSAADTSRCFARISQSSTHKVVLPNNETRECARIEDIMDCLDEHHQLLERKDQVSEIEIKVYICANCDILKENVYLYDSMGLNDDAFKYDFLKRKCESMDLMILVMSYNMNKEFKDTFRDIAKEITNIPIIILINKWDEIVESERQDNINNQKKKIEEFITETFKKNKFTETGSLHHMFYYISAKQYTKRNAQGQVPRGFFRDDFEEFKSQLLDFVNNIKRLKNERIKEPIQEIGNKLEQERVKFNNVQKELINEVYKEMEHLAFEFERIAKNCDLLKTDSNSKSCLDISHECHEKARILKNNMTKIDECRADIEKIININVYDMSKKLIKLQNKFQTEIETPMKNQYHNILEKNKDTAYGIKYRCDELIGEIEKLPNYENAQQVEKLRNTLEKFQYILSQISIVERSISDGINIVCLGSVSVGKSFIVNAMIDKPIMESSAGHTTRCFVRFSKHSSNKIKFPDNTESNCSDCVDIQMKVKNYIKNLRVEQLTTKDLIEIGIVCEGGVLDNGSVNIFDTPGIGLGANMFHSPVIDHRADIPESPDIDLEANISGYIEAIGADVLVFVVNYGISQEIETALRIYASRMPIFILINKWDENDRHNSAEVHAVKTNLENSIKEIMNDWMYLYVSGKEVTLRRNENRRRGYKEFPLFKECKSSKVKTDSSETSLPVVEDKKYFFISGKEIMKQCECPNRNQQQRFQEFQNFVETLKTYTNNKFPMRESYRRRNLDAIKMQISKIKATYIIQLKSMMLEIGSELEEYEICHPKLKPLTEQIKTQKKEMEIVMNCLLGGYFEGKLEDIAKACDDTYSTLIGIFAFWKEHNPNDQEIETSTAKMQMTIRRINEANSDMQNMKIGTKVSRGVAIGATAGVGAAGLAAAAGLTTAAMVGGIVCFPLLIGGGIAAIVCKSKANTKEKERTDCLNKCKNEFAEAYDALEKSLEDSKIERLLQERIRVYKNFLDKFSLST